MIAIISNLVQERAALSTVCESHDWASAACDSVRAFRRLLHQARPRIVITRARMPDGYSDDVFAAIAARSDPAATKIIVLITAETPSTFEARQVTLGADCVLRDPVRTDVLTAYLTRWSACATPGRPGPENGSGQLQFDGARFDPVARTLHHGTRVAQLAPREVNLIQLLIETPGEVVTYDTLYREILGRPFRGDTSNMRVLLGKLATSAQAVGVQLRRSIEVIPKTGYRYNPGTPATTRSRAKA